jgi:hypothetical protein
MDARVRQRSPKRLQNVQSVNCRIVYNESSRLSTKNCKDTAVIASRQSRSEQVEWRPGGPSDLSRKVLHHSQISAAFDDSVGLAPRPADDPLVGLLEHRKSRTRGSGADGGVRPTFGCGSAAL